MGFRANPERISQKLFHSVQALSDVQQAIEQRFRSRVGSWKLCTHSESHGLVVVVVQELSDGGIAHAGTFSNLALIAFRMWVFSASSWRILALALAFG